MGEATTGCVEKPPLADRVSWPAIWSLMLGVCSLVTAEFLPAGLLTPMARSLGVSTPLAGQAVTATAVLSFFAALFASVATRRLDRRLVLAGFLALLVVSDLLVAAARGYGELLLARALLGVALGGFWSMATAVTLRLVPAGAVPRAMSLVFSGISLATVVAVPLGSYLGGVFGWRTVFLLAAALGLGALLFQAASLPRLPDRGAARLSTLGEVLRRPGIGVGMVCLVLLFGGHFGLFTYLRPYLEEVAGMGGTGIALILTIFGLANFAGTLLAGALLARDLRVTLALTPVFIAAAGLGLAGLGYGGFHDAMLPVACLVALWGLAFGTVPVGWSTWMARAAPDETESGGGLIVAAVQLAITAGAAGGGAIFALTGVDGVFVAAALAMLATSALVFARLPA